MAFYFTNVCTGIIILIFCLAKMPCYTPIILELAGLRIWPLYCLNTRLMPYRACLFLPAFLFLLTVCFSNHTFGSCHFFSICSFGILYSTFKIKCTPASAEETVYSTNSSFLIVSSIHAVLKAWDTCRSCVCFYKT